MINLNRGRFKSVDEAQAVWKFFALQHDDAPEITNAFKKDRHPDVVRGFDEYAHNLHKARLIHGSIYDEHGRIADKAVAQAIDYACSLGYTGEYGKFSWLSFENHAQRMLESGEIRGTIFY